ncbi:MAG: peptidoglycan-binding protein [Actinomycetota bacterium]|nr:peptidoglycan-binding protein [Actinomycetota bacterium]
MSDDTQPERGNGGEAVRDLHRRLLDAGHQVANTEVAAGVFGTDTEIHLRQFQAERGLREHGRLDNTTLAALIEAGYHLGDRNLYLHSPLMRGDDVADLQLRLGSLGFDAGRIDSVFGPETARALLDFQRNTGLAADGIAGHETVLGLHQLASRQSGQTPVAQVRELDQLRHTEIGLKNHRVALGQFGSCAALAAAVARQLRAQGAQVVSLDHPDEEYQARSANGFAAELYLGLHIETTFFSRIQYFSTEGFHSAGGLRLAQRCVSALTGSLQGDCEVQGMRLPILRATRMPAVLCALGPPTSVVQATSELGEALTEAVAAWVHDPVSLASD